ncbi:hypothetical protein [Haloferula sp.]|uniref:hypothetical protein n=1 Tax=Haloferula sp. TaxID=2497595 RepID=UPI00329D0A75
MKPQHVIALVVVAVLATVAIEETRISKMRAEIIRLQAIPTDKPSKVEAIVNASEEGSLAPEESEETATPEDTTPKLVVPSPQAPISGRVIFEDFADPDEATIKQLALSSYSDFCYEFNLNNRERAYLDDLLKRRTNSLQDTAAQWMAAPPSERPAFEDMMTLIVAKSDDAIATFLNNEADAKAFASYHAMQPEREQLTAMASSLDSAGATLEMEKEKQLVEALYQARVGTGSLDWNSPAGLKAIGEGGSLDRLEKEWIEQSKALAGLLPKFLTETEASAVLQSREALKPATIDSIKSVIEAIDPKSE